MTAEIGSDNSTSIRLVSFDIDSDCRHCSLQWNDRVDQFHLWWLKDNCPTARNENGQKLLETQALDLSASIIHTQINATDLTIEWDDGQCSRFPFTYLRQFVYGSENSSQRFGCQLPQPVYWKSNDFCSLRWHRYSDVVENPEAQFHWIDDCARFGFSLLDQIPCEPGFVESIVATFGHIRETNYGRVFDVRHVQNPQNLAYTTDALGAHVDNPYRNPSPTLQLLHCLINDQEGGESTLVDGFSVASDLQNSAPDFFDTLTETAVDFEYKSPEVYLRDRKPIIHANTEGQLTAIYFNDRSMMPLVLPPAMIEPFYKAYIAFAHKLESTEYQIRFKLGPGQAVLFDNTRVLHGRTGFKADGNRHLQGCYCDRDSLLSKWAILQRELSLDR